MRIALDHGFVIGLIIGLMLGLVIEHALCLIREGYEQKRRRIPHYHRR